jgi:D-lactate dehydrogenase
MKVAIFSTKAFEKSFLVAANQSHQHKLVFFEATLDEQSAMLASGFLAVSCFVNDNLSGHCCEKILAVNLQGSL